jgi:hypothetical protein
VPWIVHPRRLCVIPLIRCEMASVTAPFFVYLTESA